MEKLKRLKQCKACPWKVAVNPHDIPNGYTIERHRALAGTIADPDDVMGQMLDTEPLRVMSCHEHGSGDDAAHCVGWFANQNGRGNNIRLRLQRFENAHLIQLDGEQHACFEDTLPENKGY